MKKMLLLLALSVAIYSKAVAQQYIYISEEGIRKFLRVDLGYTQWSMQVPDSSLRTAHGVHLLNEVKIFSGFSEDWDGFAIHDAFYFGLDMGVLKSDRHSTGTGEAKEFESKFSMNIGMGYLGMAGWRTQRWGALAGIDFRWRAARVGDLTMPNLDGPLFYLSTPLVFRAEYGMSKTHSDFRVILTGWTTLSDKKRTPYQSFRLEFPLSKEGRWWLCAQYSMQQAMSEDVFTFPEPQQTKFTQWWIGVRVGNMP
ncbi:MAG: hypothetical protein ACKVOR_09930 [Flavobacteriales bacterium]